MSQQFRLDPIIEYGPYWTEVSEGESFIEHRDALEATVFRSEVDAHELVYELDAGQLRVRRSV